MKYQLSVLSLTASGVALACAALSWAAPGDRQLPIAVADLEARSAEVFARVDADGDGLISVDEFLAHEPDFHRHPGPGHHGKPAPDAAHRPPPGPAPDAVPGADDAQRQAHRERMAEHLASMDAALFAALDGNGDGVLSADEFSTSAMTAARRSLMKREQFARLDGNADGVLTPDEFPPRRLAALDADHNGEITRDELELGRRQRSGN